MPSFVKQLVEIKKNGGKGAMRVGNIDIIRDFLDVRDVVDAYYRILTQGTPGEVYNVCSGQGIRLGDIIARAAELLDIEPSIEVDPALVRPADNAIIVGDNNKIKLSLQWRPYFHINDIIDSLINKNFEF